MGWAKLDDQMHRRRKTRGLSDPAWRLYVSAIIDCCAESSDGVIEGTYLRELLPSHHEDYVRELLARRLLHDAPGCASETCLGAQGMPVAGSDLFVVHDFHEWQMTAEEWTVRKRASEKANHKRWHADKKIKKEGCRLCYPPLSEAESESDTGSESRPDLTRPDLTRSSSSRSLVDSTTASSPALTTDRAREVAKR